MIINLLEIANLRDALKADLATVERFFQIATEYNSRSTTTARTSGRTKPQQKQVPLFQHIAVCPRCGSHDIYKMKGRNGEDSVRLLWRCRGCARQFTAKTGTSFQRSRLTTEQILTAYKVARERQGRGAAAAIAKACGVTYVTAWKLLKKIRIKNNLVTKGDK